MARINLFFVIFFALLASAGKKGKPPEFIGKPMAVMVLLNADGLFEGQALSELGELVKLQIEKNMRVDVVQADRIAAGAAFDEESVFLEALRTARSLLSWSSELAASGEIQNAALTASDAVNAYYATALRGKEALPELKKAVLKAVQLLGDSGEDEEAARRIYDLAALDPSADCGSLGGSKACEKLKEALEADAGSVEISSEPTVARVKLDWEERGTTPATIPGVRPGRHLLRIEKDGYLTAVEVVDVASGEKAARTVRLSADPALGAAARLYSSLPAGDENGFVAAMNVFFKTTKIDKKSSWLVVVNLAAAGKNGPLLELARFGAATLDREKVVECWLGGLDLSWGVERAVAALFENPEPAIELINTPLSPDPYVISIFIPSVRPEASIQPDPGGVWNLPPPPAAHGEKAAGKDSMNGWLLVALIAVVGGAAAVMYFGFMK